LIQEKKEYFSNILDNEKPILKNFLKNFQSEKIEKKIILFEKEDLNEITEYFKNEENKFKNFIKNEDNSIKSLFQKIDINLFILTIKTFSQNFSFKKAYIFYKEFSKNYISRKEFGFILKNLFKIKFCSNKRINNYYGTNPFLKEKFIFIKNFCALTEKKADIIFIDETSFSVKKRRKKIWTIDSAPLDKRKIKSLGNSRTMILAANFRKILYYEIFTQKNN